MHAKESQVAKPKQNKTKRKQERFENRFLQKMDANIKFKTKTEVNGFDFIRN